MDSDYRPTYLHQRADWPTFRWDYSAIAGRLASLRHRQGLLLGAMSALGFESRQETLLSVLVDDVQKSSEIEGEMLDTNQVRSSIASRLGMDVAGLPSPAREVDGVVEMALDATQGFDRPLTAQRLFAWHASLFPTGKSGWSKIRIGAWRDDALGPMQVVSGPVGKQRVHYEAPSADRLDAEMTAFLEWFEGSDMDLVLKAAIAHLWFVSIHPFDDGNGRIGRAIMDMALARSEGASQRFYSMSAQILKERNAYYDVLERSQRASLDVTAWVQWFLSCMEKAIGAAEGVIEIVRTKTHFWSTHEQIEVNERQRAMLNRLLDGFIGNLTTSKWAKIAKCSQDTAHRDIADLLRRGILKQNAGGGRSTSYSLSSVG